MARLDDEHVWRLSRGSSSARERGHVKTSKGKAHKAPKRQLQELLKHGDENG